MFQRLRREWRLFIACPPGSRFAELHERKRVSGRGWGSRLFWWSTGVILVVAGFVMLFTPGPGLLTMAFGVACIAQESMRIARSCDRLELRLRAMLKRAAERRRGRG